MGECLPSQRLLPFFGWQPHPSKLWESLWQVSPTVASPSPGTLPSQVLLGASVPSLQADLCADPRSLKLEHLFWGRRFPARMPPAPCPGIKEVTGRVVMKNGSVVFSFCSVCVEGACGSPLG